MTTLHSLALNWPLEEWIDERNKYDGEIYQEVEDVFRGYKVAKY